jgi:RNA polymerase sigma-70 factor (ECF subfamily)
MALMTARRQRWKGKSLDQLLVSNGKFFEPALQEGSATSMPDRSAMQSEISDIIQEVIESELTDRQRQVLILVVFNEVPMDEVVQRLGTNRNAIYKMLHDARRKLKSSLQARGFELDELLASFRARR